MARRKVSAAGAVAVLVAGVVSVLVGSTAQVHAAPRGLPSSSAGKSPPKIVSAAMRDVDRDSHADAVLLLYSVRIRHAADRDGRYPFTVAGYRIRAVGTARGTSLVLLVSEKKQPDSSARPVILYRRTASQPVLSLSGTQAATQLFERTRPHRHVPVEAPTTAPTTTTTTTTPAAPADSDGDGSADSADCAPHDRSIHPGAADKPDLAFVDSNCDGIDGDVAKSIFVALSGSDTNPGTRARPMRTVTAAVARAAPGKLSVLVAAGSFGEEAGVPLRDDVGVYGGYAPGNWSRSNSSTTVIHGSPQAVLADGATGVTLQLLTLRSNAGVSLGASTYAVRALNRSKLTIERSSLQPGDGLPGAAGTDGAAGVNGGEGGPGGTGDPDNINDDTASGGVGGFGPASGTRGGDGGDGGRTGANDGAAGSPGAGPVGGAGGSGGRGGSPGSDGLPGSPGGDGTRVGVPGVGGSNHVDLAGSTWRGHDGTDGTAGEAGSGGGGGGGGGGEGCFFCFDGNGSAGGGGGSGGGAGAGGGGGNAGGGSFGVYLRDSEVRLSAETTIKVGAGGAGGTGGRAGTGGFPGLGGQGGLIDGGVDDEVGRGGNGGRGGFGTHGGGGGGGAGGPSIGVFKAGASKVDVTSGVSIAPGAAGHGGSGGAAGLDGGDGISAAVYPVS